MIKIIDSIMGSGKTTWAISYMNAHPEERFLYVTPYLAEAERIQTACPALDFVQPTEEISKSASLNMLMQDGRNIAITHELFSRMQMPPTIQKTITDYGYTLILDEVLEVLMPIPVSKQDTKMIFDTEKIAVDEEGQVTWLDRDYKGEFVHLKRRADSHTLQWYKESIFLWSFPVKILKAFSNVFVLTFLFSGSHMKSFLDVHSLPYEIYHIQDGELAEGEQDLAPAKARIRQL
ncbi:MAG: hypothetical protein PUD16_14335 [bacterium]|nr:hypothetical protein [bacterium]